MSSMRQQKPARLLYPCHLPRNSRAQKFMFVDIFVLAPKFTKGLLPYLMQSDLLNLRLVHPRLCAQIPGDNAFRTLRVTPRRVTPKRDLRESSLIRIASNGEELQVSFCGGDDENLRRVEIPLGKVLREVYEQRGRDTIEVEALDSGARLLKGHFSGKWTPLLRPESLEDEPTRFSDWPVIFQYLHHISILTIKTNSHPGGLDFTTSSLLTSLRIGIERAMFLKHLKTLRLAPMDITHLTHFCGLDLASRQARQPDERTWERIEDLEVQLFTHGDEDMYRNQWMQNLRILQRWLWDSSSNLRTLRWHWIGTAEGRMPHPLVLESSFPLDKNLKLVWSCLTECWVGNVDREGLDLTYLFPERAPRLEHYHGLWNMEDCQKKQLRFDINRARGEDWNCIRVDQLPRETVEAWLEQSERGYVEQPASLLHRESGQRPITSFEREDRLEHSQAQHRAQLGENHTLFQDPTLPPDHHSPSPALPSVNRFHRDYSPGPLTVPELLQQFEETRLAYQRGWLVDNLKVLQELPQSPEYHSIPPPQPPFTINDTGARSRPRPERQPEATQSPSFESIPETHVHRQTNAIETMPKDWIDPADFMEFSARALAQKDQRSFQFEKGYYVAKRSQRQHRGDTQSPISPRSQSGQYPSVSSKPPLEYWSNNYGTRIPPDGAYVQSPMSPHSPSVASPSKKSWLPWGRRGSTSTTGAERISSSTKGEREEIERREGIEKREGKLATLRDKAKERAGRAIRKIEEMGRNC